MKDLLLNSFETFKLFAYSNDELYEVIGGGNQHQYNFDKICREADGTTTHSMGWWSGTNYYTDNCTD